MYINFNTYQLSRPNDCDVNYIDIYENILSDEKRKARFCGTATEPHKSEGNIINIRFHAKEGIIDKVSPSATRNFQFEILFTAFRTNERGEYAYHHRSLPLVLPRELQHQSCMNPSSLLSSQQKDSWSFCHFSPILLSVFSHTSSYILPRS